ncbi:hypothetical protein T440DRAFT_537824 [Plenodomus tracheiphilus IPT5]|uniref:DUF7918 domain-containing protein n=1 Tax=Plenodomus tracheiphilus IPT5 TaxID=1408161 RepID=A0A6A7AXD3_9PLEO|nr:hypothetical protein T440DRAFT_537824 [Plenodomus tracheiphilus IPT5]
MPSLKDLNCSIELSNSQQTLQEFGTTYGDGFVETFVPVPSISQSFSVHLTSNKFIAPGIAMYVFIDGVYQCNRNRQDLKLRKTSGSRSLVDFRVRQKEEKQKDGSMIAREWKFEKLNTVSADKATPACSPDLLANIGCIEVVVLRCAGLRDAKTASQMNMDGANDVPDYVFGIDGQSHERSSASICDDRLPFSSGRGNSFGPPPPLGVYQSPYAETVNSRVPAHSHRSTYSVDPSIHHSHGGLYAQSRHSEPLGSQARRSSVVPPFGVQYGSGPLPPVGEPFYHTDPRATVLNAPSVDPNWLDHIVTQAVKKGVAESQQNMTSGQANTAQSQRNNNIKPASQPPGAWPSPPCGVSAQEDNVVGSGQPGGGRGTAWCQSQGGWTQRPAHSRANTRIAWNDASTAWKSASSTDGWSTNKETPTDSWDTDETWDAKKTQEWKDDDRKGGSHSTHGRHRHDSWAVPPVTVHIRDQRRSKDGFAVRLRSKSRSRRFKPDEDIPSSSSDDKDGWMQNDTTSSSAAEESSDDTIQPSHSQSQVKTARSRSKRRSHRSKSAHRDSPRCQSAIKEWQTVLKAKSAPSNHTRITPIVMNSPATVHASQSRGVPPNTNFVTRSPLPAPYAPTIPDFASRKGNFKPLDAQHRSSSSWCDDPKKFKEDSFWEPVPEKENGWEDVSVGGWDKTNIDGKSANSWKNTGETSWSTVDNKKDIGVGGWGTDSDTWGAKPSSEQQKRKARSATGWNTKKLGWEADEKSTPPPTHRKKFSWGHLDTINQDPPPEPTTFPAELKPTKAASTSKRHSNKSLSKYRKFRSASDAAGPKPHWQFPPQPTSENKLPNISEHSGLFIAPKEPLLTISKEAASEKGIEHQVQAGKGMQYGHVIGRPEYLDRLDKPYAVFRFKYRSRSILQSLFGDAMIPSHGALTVPTPASNLAKAKDKLKDLPQEELIDKMLRLQSKLAEKGYTRTEARRERKRDGEGKEKGKGERRQSGSESLETEVVARGLTEKWVQMHIREACKKGKGNSKMGGRERKKEKEKEIVKGWGETKGGEEWADVKW